MNAADTRRLYAKLIVDKYNEQHVIETGRAFLSGDYPPDREMSQKYLAFLRAQATTRKENCYALALRQIEGRA